MAIETSELTPGITRVSPEKQQSQAGKIPTPAQVEIAKEQATRVQLAEDPATPTGMLADKGRRLKDLGGGQKLKGDRCCAQN